mmetsp:Transcript_29671/g.38255  ORF Transcript_29671/g.38255 Transcript_29671/m.38255 type:complete len:966 (+) Transcript_29671:115-3012(+)
MNAYRSDFYDAMLKIPDVELDMSDKTHKRMAKIKDGVVRFFNEVNSDHTHFKRPPKGNQRLVVPTDGAFVIDFNLFQLDAVHRAQAAAGHNICLKTDCGCQSLALVRGFTEAIAGADEHRKGQLEQRVMRALLEDNNKSSPKTRKGGDSDDGGDDDGDDNNEEDDDGVGGGDDMLSMLMSSAVSGSESEGEESEAPTPVKKKSAGQAFTNEKPPSRSSGPSRPQAPRYDADIRGELSPGTTARLRALTAKMEKASAELDAAALPKEFICPLTAEVFTEAVICSDGYSYERRAIDIWFLEKDVSPITKETLKSKEYIQNKAMNDLLETLKTSDDGGRSLSNGIGGSAMNRSAPTSRSSAPSSTFSSKNRNSRDSDLDSIYMNRRPSPRPVTATSKPKPYVSNDSNDEDEDEEGDEIGEIGNSFSSESGGPLKEGMVAFPGSEASFSQSKTRSNTSRSRGISAVSSITLDNGMLDDPIAEHKRLLDLIKLTTRKQLDDAKAELSKLKLKLIASDDTINMLEGTVKKVRKASRAMSIDNMSRRESSNNLRDSRDSTSSNNLKDMNNMNNNMNNNNHQTSTNSDEQQNPFGQIVQQQQQQQGSHDGFDPNNMSPNDALDPFLNVEPIVKLLCRPTLEQDVMGELLALENGGVDLAERTSVAGDRPLHLLLQFAQHHQPKTALAALKLFLAFSDANDPRTDGATALHICLVINPEHAWFLAQPLVAAGADMNYQWSRPPPNWTEVIDDTTSRSYWYNEVTGESSWELPEGVEATIPSAVAAQLAADPPMGLVDVGGGGGVGEVGGVTVYGGGGAQHTGFPEGIAIDSLLDDMLGSICAPQSWVPDNMFDACMSCDKPFGFLTRRHHCRHCGRLVCKQCQREMQGMTAWASSDPDAGTDQAGRFSVVDPNQGGGGGGRNSIGGMLGRRTSVGNRYDDSIADTIKVCRQCAAAHYRATMKNTNAAPRRIRPY